MPQVFQRPPLSAAGAFVFKNQPVFQTIYAASINIRALLKQKKGDVTPAPATRACSTTL
jgi:hypothetical protein